MNKIKQILIGATALALSGNAAAIPLEDGSSYDELSSLIQEVIDGLHEDTASNTKRTARVTRIHNRLDRGVAVLAKPSISSKREVRVERRVSRLESRIAKIITKMDLSGSVPDTVIAAINGGEGGGENGSVPEPSIIALLGLGLVGIGVARRMRKKA